MNFLLKFFNGMLLLITLFLVINAFKKETIEVLQIINKQKIIKIIENRNWNNGKVIYTRKTHEEFNLDVELPTGKKINFPVSEDEYLNNTIGTYIKVNLKKTMITGAYHNANETKIIE